MSQYAKAIASFLVSYLTALLVSVQAGAKWNDPTTYISPLIVALATTYSVYRVPNSTPPIN